MPPKALFDGWLRPDKLIAPACQECNSSTGKADLAASLASRWNYNSPQQEQTDHRRLAIQAKKQAPELIEEWIKMKSYDRTKAVNHLNQYGVAVPNDAALVTIGPRTIHQLNVFAHKATLCLYFEHFKAVLPNSGRVSAHWRTKEDFLAFGIPDEMLKILPKYGTLVQGQWNAAETFEYRYDLNFENGLFGCFARLRTGLYIAGFTVPNAAVLTNEVDLGANWIRPNQLLSNPPPAHFLKKN